MQRSLEADGYVVLPHGLVAGDIATLIGATDALVQDGRGGARRLLDVPAVQSLAIASPARDVAEAVLGAKCFAVRAILFDKTPDANWRVAWHQDVTIAVQAQSAVPEFGPWSTKADVPHVHAPAWVLEQMVAVRIHLDPCGPSNGPVRVLPGTHRSGKLSADGVTCAAHATAAIECVVPTGGLLVMRPLLVHASSPALQPGHRRVLHLEYAAVDLPAPLEWNERCAPSLMVGAI